MLSADSIERTVAEMVESFQTTLASGLKQLSKSISPNTTTCRSNGEEIRQRLAEKYWGQASVYPYNGRTSADRTHNSEKNVSFDGSVGSVGCNTPSGGRNFLSNRPTERRNASGRSPSQTTTDPVLMSKVNGASRRPTQPPTRDLSRAISLDSTSPPLKRECSEKEQKYAQIERKARDNEMTYTYTKRLVSYEMNSMLENNAPSENTRETGIWGCDLQSLQPTIEFTVQYLESMKLLMVVMHQPPNLSGDTRKLCAEVHLSHVCESRNIQKQTVDFMRSTNLNSYKHVCYISGVSFSEVSKMAVGVTVLRRRLLFGVSRTVGKSVAHLKSFGDLHSETKIVQTICTNGERLHRV